MKNINHSIEFITLCKSAKKKIKEISTDEVYKKNKNNHTLYLFDVRDYYEYNSGHICNAQFLSKGWIEAKIHNFVSNKFSFIILYCGSGNRSALAAENLQKMGYINVFSMKGGIKSWIQEGKPIII